MPEIAIAGVDSQWHDRGEQQQPATVLHRLQYRLEDESPRRGGRDRLDAAADHRLGGRDVAQAGHVKAER